MISAVYDHNGNPVATATESGRVATVEVTMNQPFYGPYNLGDFHSMVERHRPPVPEERVAVE